MTALNAPQWSVDALEAIQRPLLLAREFVANERNSDEAVERILERVVDLLNKRDEKLAAQLELAVKGKPRPWIVWFLGGLAAAVGIAVGFHDAGTIATDFAVQVQALFSE